MAASVQVIGYYGSPLTKMALTVQRYNTAIPSQRDPGLAFANNVPSSGQLSRSCWQATGLEVTGGSYSQLTYFQYGTPGNINQAWHNGAGYIQVAVKASGDSGCPVDQYIAPTGVSSQYGYDILDPVNGIPYYADESCEDVNQYTTNNPLVFDTSVITPASQSKLTKLVITQYVLADDTEFGEKDEQTNFIRWKEI